jgi:hypothetical protein
MNGNLRNFALLMIITVIAPLLLVACATTSASTPQAIQGQYVGGGVSTCIFAVCGFGDDKVPKVPSGPNGGWGTGAWSISNNSHSMVMTLEPDGTGTVSESMSSVTLNNTSPTVPWPSTGASKDTQRITYAVAPDGTFTMKDVPGTVKVEPASGPGFVLTGFSNTGHISPDGNVITMFDTGAVPHTFMPPGYWCPVPTEPKSEAQMACTATFILFKQHGKGH